METLYDILQVSKKASKEIIEKAYKTLAKKYHPDLQTEEDKDYAEKMMKKINQAYDILSDDQKRSNYDKELEEQQEKYNEIYKKEQDVNYPNIVKDQKTNNTNDYNYFEEQFATLSKKEQQKIIKKIEKEADNEYRQLYERYIRSLGLKIKHKWTFRDFVKIGIVILILIFIFFLLWIMPPTHQWLERLYNENLAIRILTNIFIGICQGIVNFVKNVTNF